VRVPIADTYGESESDFHSDRNPDGDIYAYCYGYSSSHGHSNSYGNGHSDAYGNGDFSAEGYTYAAAPAHTFAKTVMLDCFDCLVGHGGMSWLDFSGCHTTCP